MVYLGLSPLPVRVNTRIVIFLVGDSYKPLFATVTGKGDRPRYNFFCNFVISPDSPEALRLILGDLATRNAAIAREESVQGGDSERTDGPLGEGMRPVQVASGGSCFGLG